MGRAATADATTRRDESGSDDRHRAQGVVCVPIDHWLDESTGDPVLRGLAGNPGAPLDVLLRLLTEHADAVGYAFRRRPDLPPAVVEAMRRHPSTRVRAALAGNRQVDPGIRLRLVDDPEEAVVARVRSDPDLPLPDRAFRRLMDRLADQTRRGLFTPEELAGEMMDRVSLDRRGIGAAVRHPQPRIRLAAAGVLAERHAPGDSELIQALLHDEAPEVRAAVVGHLAGWDRQRGPEDLPRNGYTYRWMLSQLPLSRALIDRVLADDGEYGREFLALNPTAPADVVAELFEYPSADVRRSLARRDDLTAAQLARLATDPDPAVRTAVSTHPGLTEQQRAAIEIDVTTAPEDGHFDYIGPGRCPPFPPPRPLPPLADSTRWARSVNPLLRRRAAHDHRLPAGLAAALADDPDLGVRVLLAQHHPAAPPALLLRSFLEYHRCGRYRLLALPNFPTAGLARFADDPDPAVRRLVALDPLAEPALVDRLTGDPDDGVRSAMATCPRLRADRIVDLLDDAELAGSAAANPGLPVQVMRDRLARR
jgi:hypothetical protein